MLTELLHDIFTKIICGEVKTGIDVIITGIKSLGRKSGFDRIKSPNWTFERLNEALVASIKKLAGTV